MWVAEKARMELMAKLCPFAASIKLRHGLKSGRPKRFGPAYGLPRDVLHPNGTADKVRQSHFSVDGANVMDQAQLNP